MNSQKCSRENWKVLKTVPKARNTRFLRLNQVTCKSLGQVARHLRRNFWKIFLSVFRNWKFHPRGSHEGSHENFCVTLVTRASTREQVASLSREKSKNPDFEKFLSIFRNWDFYSPMSHEYSLSGAHNWGHTTRLTRDQVARTGQHYFFFFFFLTIFCKNKILSKNN